MDRRLHYDKDIIPFLKAAYGRAFIKSEDGIFIEESLEVVEE